MVNDTPGVARLLQLTGESEQAAFAALYDATAPRVYGLARTVFSQDDDAARATSAAYQQVWEQAPHFQYSFGPEHSDEAARNRTVAAWVETLSHETFVELAASGQHGARREARLVLDSTADLPELASLTDAQRHALSLAWAGARSYREVSDELKVGVPTLKSRLRDAVQRLNSTYRIKLSGQNVEHSDDPLLARPVTPDVAARTGQAPSFSESIDQDLNNGLLTELAPLKALDAVSSAESVALDSYATGLGTGAIESWRERVNLTERTITWAYRGLAAEPPSWLLDDILAQLPEQNVGMGFMEDFEEEDVEEQTRSPWARWLFLGLGAILAIALVLAIIRMAAGSNPVSAVDGADDLFATNAIEMADGGTVRGNVSESEDLGYLSFEDVPTLPEDQRYQVWLYQEVGGSARSLGLFTAEELLDDDATIRNVSDYAQAWVSIEPASGSEAPTSETQAQIPLRQQVSEGPQYGGTG
ncbi:MAG: anti-sigma factor domain-containing protein [Micrococcaceae bacterium]